MDQTISFLVAMKGLKGAAARRGSQTSSQREQIHSSNSQLSSTSIGRSEVPIPVTRSSLPVPSSAPSSAPSRGQSRTSSSASVGSRASSPPNPVARSSSGAGPPLGPRGRLVPDDEPDIPECDLPRSIGLETYQQRIFDRRMKDKLVQNKNLLDQFCLKVIPK